MTAPSYADFLRSKTKIAPRLGFDVSHRAFHPRLKDHQRAICQWAVRGGRRAIFSRFGLGKTGMQLETLRETLEHLDETAVGLIVLPYGVRLEFVKEAALLGIEVRFIRSAAEIDPAACRIYLTNYETVRDGRLDPALFQVVSLDEASVLRSYGSKTYQTFLQLFDAVPLRFVATATPSPNRLKELIHYAGFLGVMDTGQALTRFFQRDSERANNLTLYPHKEREFWLWVNTWAVFLQKPSDLGFSDEGYDLPPLDVRFHEIATEIFDGSFERDGQGRLLREEGNDLQAAAREKRSSLAERIATAAAIVAAAPADHFILWHDLEDERRAIEKAVPGVRSVFGSQDLDEREGIVSDFAEGRLQHIAAKPVMLGSGANLQHHCHRAVFTGISPKFNDWFQAVHRILRFGQTYAVRIDIVHTDQERGTMRILMEKWTQHEEMMETMSAIIREFGLEQLNMASEMQRAIGIERQEAAGDGWRVANNDCVEETRAMPDASVDLIVTSIPFANHYEYTPSYNDFGHTDDNAHFWAQMDFLTPELFRVLEPGRIAAIHVKDRILFGNVTGYGRPSVSPFHAEALFHFIRHGFVFCGMITVDTDVVFENNGTYRLSYSEMLKDGSKMGVGSPEYVLLFFKPQTDRSKGYADVRIAKDREDYPLARWQIDAHAHWRSSGDRFLTVEDLSRLRTDVLARVFPKETQKRVYDYREHVQVAQALQDRDALPTTFMAVAPGSTDPDIWHDVTRMRTLNGEQAAKGREKHICPLQFDIVDRLIERYSMKGETVFDPFGGLFTVPNRAIQLGRRGVAVELNDGYYRDGLRLLRDQERRLAVPTLFQLLDAAMPAEAAE
ncbi:DNA methyltransferase [Aureimonas phyllosphaerae]|uniref:site-specific DNA-methyltransferase (adenine-specific) n=1 Tax=Aureimonas phyllosphaerae TaxID=1166078 RepID=A0A7W6BTG2_9HYPH|nr:DNA methyltransferase [Aureimonas phyllosphaerae]MBB3937699.1 DNA modification methylase [Aureimonas phyllosphaerae]MBB3961766.1 DNA modification methylase [Aureimonas phyllosphaerae]SFF45196.1 DNA methylase [Aureimonas phyllosphaerae]